MLRPKELLDDLLAGEALSPEALVEFVRDNSQENQHLEYKDGEEIAAKNREKGIRTIRETVSAFANSDGGLLIIGVAEPTESKVRRITGCEQRPSGQPLDQWASRCLQDMAPYLSPQPRFHVIDHAEGPVLAVAVSRAPSLVPCIENRQLKYFLRIADSTIAAPEYLITDLVLGRREHPLLDLYSIDVKESSEIVDLGGPNQTRVRRTFFTLVVENLGLAPADDVRIGMISWSLQTGGAEINRHLRAHLDVPDPGDLVRARFQIVHRSTGERGRQIDVDRFTRRTIQEIGPFSFPSQDSARARAAVYVKTKAGPPTWFQLQWVGLFTRQATTTLERVTAGRPEVMYVVED